VQKYRRKKTLVKFYLHFKSSFPDSFLAPKKYFPKFQKNVREKQSYERAAQKNAE
jgi:hypothetical protein